MKTLLLSLLTIVAFSCKTPKAVSDLTQEDVKIEMTKGSCFGKCPVYTIKVYEGGHTKLHAVRFGDKEGKYTRKLSKKDYKKLITAFDESKFNNFKNIYESDIVDLPLVSLGFRGKKAKVLKMTRGRDTRPDKLMKLQYLIEDLYDKEGWVKGKPLLSEMKNEKFDKVSRDKSIRNKIIVKTSNDLKIEDWIVEMNRYQMKLVRTLSKDLHLYLVTYNTRLTRPTKMLRIIKEHPSIMEAEFDKKVQSRSK